MVCLVLLTHNSLSCGKEYSVIHYITMQLSFESYCFECTAVLRCNTVGVALC